MSTSEAVGREIRRLRKAEGKTLKELGAEVGVSAQYISSVELGQENPTVDFMERVAPALNTRLVIQFQPVDRALSAEDQRLLEEIAALPLDRISKETKDATLLMLRSLVQMPKKVAVGE